MVVWRCQLSAGRRIGGTEVNIEYFDKHVLPSLLESDILLEDIETIRDCLVRDEQARFETEYEYAKEVVADYHKGNKPTLYVL